MSSLRVFTHDLGKQLKCFYLFSPKSISAVTKKCIYVNFLEMNRQKSKYTNRVIGNQHHVKTGRPNNRNAQHGKEFYQANFDPDEAWDDDEADEKMEKMNFYDDEPNQSSKSDRWRLKMNIIKKKYFKDKQEVSVLTWEAKEQIRFLHRDAPDNWTVESLAESFPISEAGVQKILQSSYRPRSFSEVQNYNRRVRNKWLALKKALDSDDKDTVAEFRYLLEPNKVQVLLNAKGNLDLPMPRQQYSWEANQLRGSKAKETGLFESIVEDYKLALSSKSDNLEFKKLPETDGQESVSDDEILSEIKFLADDRNGNATCSPIRESNLSNANNIDVTEITQNNNEQLSRRQRRVHVHEAPDGKSASAAIDLTNLPTFESLETKKISHKVHTIISDTGSGNNMQNPSVKTSAARELFSEPPMNEQAYFCPTERESVNLTKKKSREGFKNSFQFSDMY